MLGRQALIAAVTVALALATASARGADEAVYFQFDVDELRPYLPQGALDAEKGPAEIPEEKRSQFRPHVSVDGPGEAYWFSSSILKFETPADLGNGWGQLVARLPKSGDFAGTLYYPNPTYDAFRSAPIKIPAGKGLTDVATRNAFYTAKRSYYQTIQQERVPGEAWFRHQIRESDLVVHGARYLTGSARPADKDAPGPMPAGAPMPADAPEGFRQVGPAGREAVDYLDATFTGDHDRTAAEQLKLDRVLEAARADETVVRLDSIRTAPVKKFDWKPRLEGKNPAPDPLAACVPADQYAMFFPTFDALIRLIDETAGLTSLARTARSHSQDYRLIDRYRRQFGLRVTAAGRMLGPRMIESAAFTGGDVSFELGTDVAVLFEARDPAALHALLRDRISGNTAEEPQVKREAGEMLGVRYDSWSNDLRTVSSYLATIDDAVVLTNSPVQLQRIVETRQGKRPAISGLDEYRYFRERYPKGDADETALVVVSAATMHRSSSPRQIIGESRRLRDAAVLAELQAANLEALAGGTAEPKALTTDLRPAGGGDVELTAAGVRSSTAGSLDFLKPVIELDLDRVTKSEARAYEKWLDGRLKDTEETAAMSEPVAFRFTVADERLAIDVTTTAKIDAGAGGEFVEVLKGAKLTATSGDPHRALAHAALAFNRGAPQLKQWSDQITSLPPPLQVDLLGWLGGSVSVYAADDPFWGELARLETDEERVQFVPANISRLPVAVNVEIASAIKATALLAAVRGLVDVSAPGTATWEARNYGEYSYVKVRVKNEDAAAAAVVPEFSVYYALTADLLTVSPSEALIKRALDRQARRDGKGADKAEDSAKKTPESRPEKSPEEKPQNPWLGENIAVEVGELAVRELVTFIERERRDDDESREKSWGNLPALNEWTRLFPEQDPVALHERLWGARLVCPGGGQYVWNEKWRTMESTVYGHPGEPKEGDAPVPLLRTIRGFRFGLTFDDPGLRLRAEFKRQP